MNNFSVILPFSEGMTREKAKIRVLEILICLMECDVADFWVYANRRKKEMVVAFL